MTFDILPDSFAEFLISSPCYIGKTFDRLNRMESSTSLSTYDQPFINDAGLIAIYASLSHAGFVRCEIVHIGEHWPPCSVCGYFSQDFRPDWQKKQWRLPLGFGICVPPTSLSSDSLVSSKSVVSQTKDERAANGENPALTEALRLWSHSPFRRCWIASKHGEQYRIILSTTARQANALARSGWLVNELRKRES